MSKTNVISLTAVERDLSLPTLDFERGLKQQENFVLFHSFDNNN